MDIVALSGVELEKALPNSPEDGFSRSIVTYIDNNKENTFQLLYVRYFEEIIIEELPYSGQPLFISGNTPCYIRDLAAWIYLMANPEAIGKKEVYLHDETPLVEAFRQTNWEQVEKMFSEFCTNKKATVRSPILFIKQP
ncbi:MAG TPA: hypothetical protein VNM69_07905 [Bacillus sp. (in: firmicutes)]|uniref:hypothetical protein n=1 Tax=Bacillus litorisediminis TaxID=2922713 RepID=UPI001FAF6144|nr:hypothetical protein [Bacillus litorisediminis]HWO75814.1 hypothetical protein [Bacillus sp. (in: firmicutes)]